MDKPILVLLSFVASSTPLPALAAQCSGAFDARFPYPGLASPTLTLCKFDDGSGARLFVGGTFSSAGGLPAGSIASFDGVNWSTLAGGADATVGTTLVFDDGSGPALYAGGQFTSMGGISASHIARWNGTAWSAVGAGLAGPVDALAVFDDGSGAALHAVVTTAVIGGTSSVARWNGSTWSPIGSAFAGRISALASFDDGSGEKLYAGGFFSAASGTNASNFARWDGNTWSAVGQGMDDEVQALQVFDDGQGPQLYAGGRFSQAGGNAATRIARWDGTNWSPLGTGIGAAGAQVSCMTVFDDGTGPALYAGGNFSSAGAIGTTAIAKWNGSVWSALGSGIDGGLADLGVFDDGTGAALYVAGEFLRAGGVFTDRIARWDGTRWSALGQGLNGQLTALRTAAIAGPTRLYAAGSFTSAGSVTVGNVASWDGNAWLPLGSGFPFGGVHVLLEHDDGSGLALMAGGEFTSAGGTPTAGVAAWNGANWSALGLGVSGSGARVTTLARFDDGGGPDLYAGGSFTSAGGIAASNIARWDGAWSAVGAGVTGAVSDLLEFDDGTGAALYAAGSITSIAGASAQGFARWDGATWTALPGPGFGLTDLIVFDDGAGAALYGAGIFSSIGGIPANNIARFTGTGWVALGLGVNGWVDALGVFDDGTGSALYVGGAFTSAGGAPAQRIARWDGTSWSAVGAGVASTHPGGIVVRDMAVFQDGADAAPDLYLGGVFLNAGGFGSAGFAQWHGCPPTAATYCFGDGTGAACPCGNAGGPGRGCASSVNPNGGRVAGSGTPSIAADTLVLAGDGMPNGAALYFQGTLQVNGGNGSPFGDGLRCAGGAVIRLGTRINVAGASQFPDAGTQLISLRGLNVSGGTRNYQVWYRNAAAFCTSDPFNLTNGVTLTWIP